MNRNLLVLENRVQVFCGDPAPKMTSNENRVEYMVDFKGGAARTSVDFCINNICVDKKTVSLMDRVFLVNCPDHAYALLNIPQFKLLVPMPWNNKICQIPLMHTIGKLNRHTIYFFYLVLICDKRLHMASSSSAFFSVSIA